MMRDWAAPGGRTVLVKALPPGKDRADFTEFLRENHSFGFEHVKFDTDEGISILYDTHQNAKFALDSITQSTAIDITWAAQDLIPDPSLLSSRALHAVEPNPVVYIEPALTPLSPDEVKKLLMAYRGCESFDIISKEELNYDRDRGVGRAPHQGRASSARFYYYALFRDVFCAETAIEDLNKCIGIPATYARNHERVRNILEGKVARLGTAATPAPATPRNNSAMLTWIHVAEIPTDVDFAKLRAHFGRLEGFRCLSFQPNGVLLGFATEPYAKRAAEMLLKNTRMDVNPATPDAVQTVQQVTTAMAVSQPATTLCVHLTPYAPVHRVSEMVHVYAGVQEVKPDAAHVYVRFASLDESVRAVTDLEATTDLALEFVPGFGVAKDHNLGVLSPTGTTPARPASTHPGGGLVTAAGLPTRPRTTRADSTISTASSAAATPFPHQHQHPTDHHGAISISPFDTTTVLMASHPTPTPPSHYDPRYLSDAAIFISAKDLPHVKFSLRHSVGTLDGFTRMAFQEEGFYAWFTTRDHAAKAVGRLEGEKHITPTLIKRPQTRTPHAPHPMRPLTAEHYQGALFVRCPWALTLDGLQCILEAYPGYMTCRHLRDAIIVDYVNHEVAEKVVRDLQETTNIRVEWSTRSAQPGNRYMVDDAGDEAAHERRYSAPRPMEPLARPAFAPAQTSRTLVVSTAVPVDKADTRAIVAKLPGFSRVRFQGINFHIAFQTPELAAQALPLIKRSQPAWKASAAKTDIPPLPEQLAAVQEAKNPKPPPSTVLEIANAGWTEAECIKLLESFHGFESVDYDSDTSRAYFSDGRTCQRACVDINSTTDLVAAYEKRGEDRLAGQGLSFVGAAAAAAKVLREGGGHAEEGPVMVHNAEPADVVVHAWKQQPAPDTTTTPPTTVTPAWKQHAFDSTPPKATTEPWWKRRTPPVATPTTPTPTDAAPHAWKKAEIIDTAEHAWRVWANTPAVSSHPTLSGGGVENLWARDLAGGVVDPWKRNEAAAATEDAWGPPSAEGGARWGAPVLSSFTPTVSNSAPATSAAGFAGNWPDRPANYISTPNSAARFKDRPPAPAVVADWPVHVPGEVGERAATPAVVPAWPVARTLGDGAVPSVVVEVEKRGTLTEVFARPGVGEGVQEVEFGWDMGRNAHGKAESVEAHHAPQETLSNIIMIRNCSIQSADEMARYLAVHANFEDVICENVNGAVVWYAKFADVKSAEIVRHSYEVCARPNRAKVL
ncbi:uncharacterized protein EV422DRAFT_542560 [Fimicolochytrium jonesii]|uniref:uncharacterized protein n=1 Tax=Fimicolochytrium jonesii TaxID=1396493 RepID=UPI0022FE5B68|nr:uncharacterized protein EV422DRAFT_542560 [Fimicolochytrium jonesii]KAI8817142.1 hypothetical protein EV422DRAFT_542560 [Fimicolochytrium jonesii]